MCVYSTKVNEGAVATDDLDNSVYYVKDALDANVTYAAGPHANTEGGRGRRENAGREGSSGGSEEGERWEGEGTHGDVDTPDMGGELAVQWGLNCPLTA